MASPVGKRLKDKKISEVVNPRLIQALPSITVKGAVDLMRENKSAYIVVADGKRVVGMFTESDVIGKILGKDVDWNRPVRDFMTPTPLVLRPDDTVGRAVSLMADNDVYTIPLVSEAQELTGVLSVRTLIRFLAEFYPGDVYNLPPNPHQIAPTQEGG